MYIHKFWLLGWFIQQIHHPISGSTAAYITYSTYSQTNNKKWEEGFAIYSHTLGFESLFFIITCEKGLWNERGDYCILLFNFASLHLILSLLVVRMYYGMNQLAQEAYF